MNYADRLVILWAAKQFDFEPFEFDRLEIGTFDGCWSEYTQDYGIEYTVHLKDGTKHYILGDMPDLVQEIVDMDPVYKELAAKQESEHAADHGWDET